MTICGTVVGTMSSASVLATTSATLNPEAVSIKVARPQSLPCRSRQGSMVLADVSGRLHFVTILDFPLAACCMAVTTRFAPVTRSMAPPSHEDAACARSRSTSAGVQGGLAARGLLLISSSPSSPVLRQLGYGFGAADSTFLSPDVSGFCEMPSRLIPTGLERPRLPSTKRIFDGRKHQLFPFHLQPQPEPSAILHFSRQRLTVSSGSR